MAHAALHDHMQNGILHGGMQMFSRREILQAQALIFSLAKSKSLSFMRLFFSRRQKLSRSRAHPSQETSVPTEILNCI